jgi:hypothetical protein
MRQPSKRLMLLQQQYSFTDARQGRRSGHANELSFLVWFVENEFWGSSAQSVLPEGPLSGRFQLI